MAGTVACPADFDVAWALRFLAVRAVAGVEEVGDRRYQRVIRTRTGPGLRTAEFVTRAGVVTARPGGKRGTPSPEAWLTRQFDLDGDRADFVRMARADPILGPLVRRRPGLRLPLLPDPFEALVRAIVGQVVSVSAAATFLGRIANRFGEPLGPGPARWRAFPSAETLATARPPALRAAGLTAAKTKAIIAAARAVTVGEIDWTEDALRTLAGIGPWTANYVRLRGLNAPDAFLPTDLGIVTAMKRLGVDPNRVEQRAEAWRPWRGYAVPYLWSSLADPP